jgi:hypothetical protein
LPAGWGYLIARARPFLKVLLPAENGPIFLCPQGVRVVARVELPPALVVAPTYLLEGYSVDHRIVCSADGVVPAAGLRTCAGAIL